VCIFLQILDLVVMTDLDAQAFFLVYNKYIDDPLSFEALLLKTFFPSFLWRPFYDKKKEKEWKRRLWERMVRILKWRVSVFEMGNFVGKENAQVGWAFNCGRANYAAMSQWGKALA